MSNSKVSLLNDLINRPEYIYRAPTAALECQEMGDYCFDPQFGLYKNDDTGISKDSGKVLFDEKGPLIPAAKSIDRDLINCDSQNYFDVFCGKARKESGAKNPRLELWIDTSSSMREFDYSDKEGNCYRKSLVRALDNTCGFNQKVNVMMFNTSIKQVGTMDQLCDNVGLNEYKRLIDWIERSDAERLVVITDIYEFHKEFSDYIESKHGKFRGDKVPLTARDMVELSGDLAKTCK